MASSIAGILGMVMMLMCLVTSSEAYFIHGRNEVETKPSVGQTDYDDMMISEMMTSEEEAEVDDMFPAKMRDELKLELILKALVILKTYEGDSLSVPAWLPPYDGMPNGLKLKLILKAIVLLKDRPLDSKFAGHTIGELKLTLILKALWIIHENKSDLDLAVDSGDLKLTLLLKAIDTLEVYKGEYKDIVFFTESNKQLKLKLILKAITLLKHGKWPIDIDFWPMGKEEEEEGSQSEVTNPEPNTDDFVTEQTATTEGAINETATPDEPTSTEATGESTTEMMRGPRGRGDIPAEEKQPVKRAISKVFKLLKWVPKVLHKKKHHIFH